MSKKPVSERKQDLLLDALSCIDEDILAKGLALRESGGLAAKTERGVEPLPAKEKQTPATPLLYDLTQKPAKPPKQNRRRVLAVVAAACLLLCAVPTSLWMVARFGSDFTAGDKVDADLNDKGNNGIFDGFFDGIFDGNADESPDEGPGEGPVGNAPGYTPNDSNAEVKDPTESDLPNEEPDLGEPDPEAPATDEMEAETVGPMEWVTVVYDSDYDPERLDWRELANTNGQIQYQAQGSTGTELTLQGSVLTPGAISDQAISAEDEAAVKLVGQWVLSVFSLDYANHFPLFNDAIVQERFISEAVGDGKTYAQAVEHIGRVVSELFPTKSLTLDMELTENDPMSADELDAYLSELIRNGVNPYGITAARSITLTGIVTLDGLLLYDLGDLDVICYEQSGVWYLDCDCMDDDLSVDLLQSDNYDRDGYFKEITDTVTVTGKKDGYLFTDEGRAFGISNAVVYMQTDNGEWDELSASAAPASGTVTVTYFSFELEGFRILGESETYTVCTASEIRVGG